MIFPQSYSNLYPNVQGFDFGEDYATINKVKPTSNDASAGWPHYSQSYANTNYPSPSQPASSFTGQYSSAPAPPPPPPPPSASASSSYLTYSAPTSNKQKKEKRIVLILGKTGEGKSTLANVLTGTNNFEESEGSVSQTKEVQVETAELDDISLQVVDTIGICDTSMPRQKVLTKIAHACHSVNSGVHQIIFVVGLRFTEELILIYEVFQKALFDGDMAKHTTFVRTRFGGFTNPARCEEDIRKMRLENSKLRAILEQSKIIHVNNPSVPSDPDDEDALKLSQRDRGRSREILLRHLRQCRELYCPPAFREVVQIITPDVIHEQQLADTATKTRPSQLNISITNYSTSNPSSYSSSDSSDSSYSSYSSGSYGISSKYYPSSKHVENIVKRRDPTLWDSFVNVFTATRDWIASWF